MNHGSLFSGIGGFDLAAEWMGWENIFHCEWNEFGQRVLKYYWPDAISYADIKSTDFTIHRGQIDILTGGFPCQPYSQSGKRLGKEDDRHLWPEMLRAIREIQPRYVVAENVRGLTNWNGGMVFDEVQTDLENEGYEVTPYLLPACAVNAPHRRDRIWFVAYSKHNRHKTRREKKTEKDGVPSISRKKMDTGEPNRTSFSSTTSNTRLQRQAERKEQATGIEQCGEGAPTKFHSGSNWQDFPTQPPVCGRDDGLSSQLDGITFPKWRNESIKAYGNAIVPQIAFEIFKAIERTIAR